MILPPLVLDHGDDVQVHGYELAGVECVEGVLVSVGGGVGHGGGGEEGGA